MNTTEILTTNLKFYKHSKTGKVVGFVSKIDRNWRGVRESTPCKKVIVLIDTDLSRMIQEDRMYKCKLVPMANKVGFVAVSATPMLFNAEIETEMFPKTYKVKIRYGKSTVVFDPNSPDNRFNSFKAVSDYLIGTHMIKDVGNVVEELRNSINVTAAQYV